MSEHTQAAKVRAQVLVVGAGAVGLFAALRLRRLGVDVAVVDQRPEVSAMSSPVVLHARSMRLLDELGLAETLRWCGRVVPELALFVERERRLTLDLTSPLGWTSSVLTLPRDVLQLTLQSALAELGVKVTWATRLATMQQDEHRVSGHLVQRHQPAAPAASHERSLAFESSFLIGADGYESAVRASLGVRLVEHGPLRSFAFFEAETRQAPAEAQLALADGLVSSSYPLHGGRTRYTFQLAGALDRALDSEALGELLSGRMPWRSDGIQAQQWSGVGEFRRALVARFGTGRVWLAGDAAHTAEPLGVQSLNVGLDEADELARQIAGALRQPRRPTFGEHYERRRQLQWQALIGARRPSSRPLLAPFIEQHRARLVDCLPASGGDLAELMRPLATSAAE